MHARVLLMSDADHPLGRYTDARIARHLAVSERTVGRTWFSNCEALMLSGPI